MKLRPPFLLQTTPSGGRGSGQAANLFDLTLLLQTRRAAQMELRRPIGGEACHPFERPDDVFFGLVVLLCDVFSTVPPGDSAGTFTIGEPDDEPARRF
jgi:hypothetical protein